MNLPDIGLVGKARSGKDTVAGMLVEHHGYHRVAFADRLKAAALDIDPVVTSPAPAWWHGRLAEVVEELGWEAAKEIPEVRRFLQHLGVAVRDHVDADAWVAAAGRDIDALHGTGRPVVVSDVRFENEVQAIASRGGLVVRIERPEAGLSGAVGDHVSERLECDVDAVLVNDGSLTHLQWQVDGLVEFALSRV